LFHPVTLFDRRGPFCLIFNRKTPIHRWRDAYPEQSSQQLNDAARQCGGKKTNG
jgi:hypothetical protein